MSLAEPHDDASRMVAPPLRLLPPQPVAPLPQLDGDSAQAFAQVQADRDSHWVILGAAGTGKSTLALSCVQQAMDEGRSAVLLTPTRARAAQARERLHAADGVVRVYTPAAFALTIVSTWLTARPQPLPAPVLLAGAEEDTALARLLPTVGDEHIWGVPEETLHSVAFRAQIRNLLARCGELGVSAEQLEELGEELDVPMWRPAAQVLRLWDAQGLVTPENRATPRTFDTVRLQDHAVRSLRRWQEDEISVPPPVPELVVVDDYQDCTAATARLLTALAQPDAAGRRSQIVVLGNPDVAVETFRGGTPTLLSQAESTAHLGARRLTLHTARRGGERLQRVWSDQAQRLPVLTDPQLRRLEPAPAEPDGADEGRVDVVVASSPVQEAAHVARYMREAHVAQGVPLSDMAVIVRSQAQVDDVYRELSQRGVPVAPPSPAVLLRAEPAAAALMGVSVAALRGHWDALAAWGSGVEPSVTRAGHSDSVEAAGGVKPQAANPVANPQAVSGADSTRSDETTSGAHYASTVDNASSTENAGEDAWDAARRLLNGPLVGLTDSDLRVLRRYLREHPEILSTPGETLPQSEAENSSSQGAEGSTSAASLAATSAGPSTASPAEPPATASAVIGPREMARVLTEPQLQAAVRASLSTTGDDPAARQNSVQRVLASVLRAASIITSLREYLHSEAGEHPSPDALMWRAWEASGRAADWQAAAVAGDTSAALRRAGAAADHQLDVITALFKRAEVWAERHPGGRAMDFFHELLSQVIPSDSVAPAGRRPEAVTILTPAAAAGESYAVVAVMGVTRGTWPNLQLRDSLTRTGLLVDALTDRLPLGHDGHLSTAADPASALASVAADERRMFLAALTRARQRLLVTSVQDTENTPSSFLLQVAASAGHDLLGSDGELRISPDATDLTLTGMVAMLRHQLALSLADDATQEDIARGQDAARLLARLAQAQVRGADPDTWMGCQPVTTDMPVIAPGDRISVSPSDVESLGACPLQWFLTRHGASGSPSSAQTRGTFIHDLADAAAREGWDALRLMEECERRLPTIIPGDSHFDHLEAEKIRGMVKKLGDYLTAAPRAAHTEYAVRAAITPRASDGQAVPIQLRGRIDRLEFLDGDAQPANPQDPPRVRIVDFKTGSKKDKEAARNPQLASYSLALRELGYDPQEAALVRVGGTSASLSIEPGTKHLDPSPDPETGERWDERLVADAARHAVGPEYPARSNSRCDTCAAALCCPIDPRGMRVSS